MRGLFEKESGFTLIEILVAVTIVGISFAVIVEGYLTMTGLVQQMKEHQLASSCAREKMNQLIQKIEPASAGLEELSGIPMTWKSINIDMGDGVRRVTVYVEWASRKGPKQFQLTTLIEGGSYE